MDSTLCVSDNGCNLPRAPGTPLNPKKQKELWYFSLPSHYTCRNTNRRNHCVGIRKTQVQTLRRQKRDGDDEVASLLPGQLYLVVRQPLAHIRSILRRLQVPSFVEARSKGSPPALTRR